MPETNDGPAALEPVTALPASASTDPLPGFAESMTSGWGNPEPVQGEPESAKAVETVAATEAPKTEAVTPAKEPAKDEAKPDAAKAVNFDGLSEPTKTYWENALKAGHATPADVERARIESLFQKSWTKNHDKLKGEREAFETEKARIKEDIALLEKIRADDRMYAAWLKMFKGEVAAEDPAADELVDGKKAADIARKAIEAREAEQASRTAKEQAAYVKKVESLKAVIGEQIELLSVTPEVMQGYLKELEATLPANVDPILAFTPEQAREKIAAHHERKVLLAKVAALEAQVSQRASKQVQASKQSLPPTRRVSESEPVGLAKVMADLGVASLSDVPGFGWGPNGR